MSLLVETRPERVLYNAEVTLRMVDQLLAELGGGSLPIPTGPRERSTVERVTHALMLVESVGTVDPHASEMGRRLLDRLRGEQRALLRDLGGRVEDASRGVQEGLGPATCPTAPALHLARVTHLT